MLTGRWTIHSEFPESPKGSPDYGIHRNFELRTIRVVTLAPIRSDDGLATRTMRYDAIGCPLPADKELVALFEASSPIHAGRNGLRRPIEKMGVSRLPPSYRHAVVSPGTISPRPSHVRLWFLSPIALSDSCLCTSTKMIPPSTRSRSQLFRTVKDFRQTASSVRMSAWCDRETGAAQVRAINTLTNQWRNRRVCATAVVI
jgi:hypothetical protein